MNEKITRKIDTDTYNKIGNTMAVFSSCSFIAGQALSHSYMSASMASYALSVFGYYEALSLYANNNKEYTTDGIEVLKLYRQFIKKYNKLNKELNFKTPIEIFTLFNYLYNNGYLSKNKRFKYNIEAKTSNIGALMGSNVIAGEGVCRHISGLLSDIMNGNGMDSINLSVYLNDYFVYFDIYNLVRNRKKELFDWAMENVLDRKSYNKTMDIIKESSKVINPTIIEDFDTNIIGRISGNHAITYVDYNDMNYYLDPTSGTIFRMCPVDKKLYSEKEVLKIKGTGAKLIVSDKSKYKELFNKAKMYTDSISLEEEKRIVNRTSSLIEKNRDMFEDFYSDNRGLYDEISYKTLKLK